MFYCWFKVNEPDTDPGPDSLTKATQPQQRKILFLVS